MNIQKSLPDYIPNADYAHHPAYGLLYGKPSLQDRFKALTTVLPQLARHSAKRILMGSGKKQSDPERVESALLQEVIDHGAAAVHIPPVQLQAIRELFQPQVDTLQIQRNSVAAGKRRFGENQYRLKLQDHPHHYKVIRELLNEYGIVEFARRYLHRNIDFHEINLQVNDSTDTFWKGNFRDIGHPDPRTSNMHVDTSTRAFKCLMYLSDVLEDNGPFSYVLGSHRIEMGFLESIARRANDDSLLSLWDPEHRRLFWSLPSFLRYKAEFGVDLTEEVDGFEALLENERVFTSRDGDFILFDNDGIHRGGRVTQGTRIILQISLYIKIPKPKT